MPGPRPPSVDLTAEERRDLAGVARRHKTGQHLGERARIVLRAADGLTNSAIARRLGLEPATVRLWRPRGLGRAGVRLAELAVAARLADAPRSGTPARITPEPVGRTMALACAAPGAAGRPSSQGSTTELAAELMRRGSVATISPRHAARLLNRGPPAAPDPLLVDAAGRRRAGRRQGRRRVRPLA